MPTAPRPTGTKVLALFGEEWWPATVESYYVLVKWEGEASHSLVALGEVKPHPTSERMDQSIRLAIASGPEGTNQPTIGGPEGSCPPGANTEPTIGGDQVQMVISPGARVWDLARKVEGIVDHWDEDHQSWSVVGPRNILESDDEEGILERRQHLVAPEALIVKEESLSTSLMEQVLNARDCRNNISLVDLPWRVPCRPGWGGQGCPTLQSICAVAPPFLHPFLHSLTDQAIAVQHGTSGPTPRLWDLPYDLLVKIVFTRATIFAGVHHPSHRMFSYEQLAEVLKAHDLDTLAGLGLAIANWMKEKRLVRDLLNCEISDGVLTVINRPGAWLLDCLHTEQLAIVASDPAKWRDVEYKVVSNKALCALHDTLKTHIFTPNMPDPPYRGLNYRGNQFEYLAWLALEGDRPHIALAIAWHARQVYWNE